MVDSPILSVEHLTKRFESAGKKSGIFDVGFELRTGEVLCLVGPSGAGKSTLLRCLAGIESVDSGSIVFLGKHNLHAQDGDSARARREGITMVFQDFNLWPHLTVLENIVLAPISSHGVSRSVAERRATDLLKKFDLLDKRLAYPSSLSGGQRQRVAIIRALATEPKLLLLDEITSALDPELVAGVLNAIKILAKDGQSMIIATHHLKFAAEVATRIVFMEGGEVVQERSVRDFVFAQDNPRIAEYIRAFSLERPEINVYRGFEEFQAFQIGTLKRSHPGSFKCVVGSSGDRWFEAMGGSYAAYETLRVERAIGWRMLMHEESPLDRDVRDRFPELNDYRLIPRGVENPANFYVIDDVVVIQIFGSPGDEPSVIEIKNPHVAKSYQNYFNLLWEQSGPVK